MSESESDQPIYHDNVSTYHHNVDTPENWQSTPDSPIIEYQEAKEMTNSTKPTIIVLGVLNGAKVVKGDWVEAQTLTLSDRTIGAIEKLGVAIHDEPSNYVF